MEPFRSNSQKFIAALRAAGATVTINAIMRPKQRAFLMHWSFNVARKGRDPETVPELAGVDIDWSHRGLRQVGASYGVIKLASDPPHWSSDGH